MKIASFQMVSTFAFFPQYPTASSYNFEFGQLSRTRARKLREQNFQLSTQCSEIRKKNCNKKLSFCKIFEIVYSISSARPLPALSQIALFSNLGEHSAHPKKGKKIIEKKGTANFVGGFQ